MVTLASGGERYTLRADWLQDTHVQLNGQRLSLTDGDELPPLAPSSIPAGRLRLPPASVTFLVMPDVAACR